ncbi:Alpha/Beta hydrolase protein [Trichoderma sp. SZMC 28014]
MFSTQRIGVLPRALAIFSLINTNIQIQASSLKGIVGKDGAVTYAGEHISWMPCGDITGHLVECSSLEVPIDQFNKANSGNKTFNLSVARLRGNNTKVDSKNIFYNPGGPGASAVGYLYELGSQLISIVGEDFNIIAVDPRGINGSTPLGSCYATEDVRMAMSKVPLNDVVTDAPFYGSWAPNFAKSCSQTSGDHGKYINTPQVAADMNSVLDAIGQDDMWYWGQSYGTLLGQTYAGLFPNRTARMTIDGVVNQHGWYNETLQPDYKDGKRVFWGFCDECIKAGKEACPLAALADNADDLNKVIDNFGAKVKANEMAVYVNATDFGSVGYSNLWYYGISPSLYKSIAFQPLSIILSEAMLGNASLAYLAYGGSSVSNAPLPTDESIYFYRLNDGLSGPKFWPQDNEGMINVLEPFYNVNPLIYAANSFYWAKARWQIPKTHDYVPRQGVETKYPLLILSTQYDPVCSWDSANGALSDFAGSRLVTLDGYGHCTFYQNSDCANNYVKAYFANGTMPSPGATCHVGKDQYFPTLPAS